MRLCVVVAVAVSLPVLLEEGVAVRLCVAVAVAVLVWVLLDVIVALTSIDLLAVGVRVCDDEPEMVGLMVGDLVDDTDEEDVLVGVTLGHRKQIRSPRPFGPHGHWLQQSAKSSQGPPSNCIGTH